MAIKQFYLYVSIQSAFTLRSVKLRGCFFHIMIYFVFYMSYKIKIIQKVLIFVYNRTCISPQTLI